MKIEADERGYKIIVKQHPVQKVRFPEDPPENCFLRTLPHKQPLSVAEVAANYRNNAESQLEHDLSADGELHWRRCIDTMRLRKNFTKSSYLHIFQPFDKDSQEWPPCLEDDEFAMMDRFKPVSVLLRNYFLLPTIPADTYEAEATAHEQTKTFVPYDRTRVAALYRHLLPRNPHRKYYLKGMKRPMHLIVARTLLPIYAGVDLPSSTSYANRARFSIAECPSEIVAFPEGPAAQKADMELWSETTYEQRTFVFDALGLDRDAYNEETYQDADVEDLAEFYYPPPGTGLVLDAERYERMVAEDFEHCTRSLYRTQRRAALLAVKNLLILHEMCGAVYAYMMIKRRFSRMYMLGNGRIAIEMTPKAAAELVDMAPPPDSRAAVDWKTFWGNGDLYERLPNDFALGAERYVDPPERWPRWAEPDDERFKPNNNLFKSLTIDHATWQTHQDFLSAATLRLGALSTGVRPSRLPTPLQDEVTDGVYRLLQSRLPPELVDYIFSMRPALDDSVCLYPVAPLNADPPQNSEWKHDRNKSIFGGHRDGNYWSNPENHFDSDTEDDRDWDSVSTYSSSSEYGMEYGYPYAPDKFTFTKDDWGPDWEDLEYRYDPAPAGDYGSVSERSAELDIFDGRNKEWLGTPVHIDALAVTIQALASFVPTTKDEMDALVARQVELDMARYSEPLPPAPPSPTLAVPLEIRKQIRAEYEAYKAVEEMPLDEGNMWDLPRGWK